MQKVTHSYKNVNKLFDYIEKLYYDTSDTDKSKCASLLKTKYPLIFKDVVDLFDVYGYHFDFEYADIKFDPITIVPRTNSDKCVMVCVSGGKDSTATAKYYIDSGYDVYLYHMIGINKCYPDECKRVADIAEYFNIPVIYDTVKVSGNHIYIEHPLKNFILVDGAIHYALSLGITNISVGDFDTATLSNNAFEVCGGDCYELWDKYRAIIQTIIPDFDVLMPLHSAHDSLQSFVDDKHLLELTQSCMGTFRFRDYKRKYNIDKYHIDIMPHRCGSCWKCAVEYIYYADHDVLDFNVDYYKHCLDILLMDMRNNGLMPFTPEFIWYNYMGYNITESKIYEELKSALVQSRKIKYNSKEIAREISSAPIFGDKQ